MFIYIRKVSKDRKTLTIYMFRLPSRKRLCAQAKPPETGTLNVLQCLQFHMAFRRLNY